MFTGIIETLGLVKEIIPSGSNIDIWVQSNITNELKIDQSVAHNGVCLTVVAIDGDAYKVTAVAETINKTNLGKWLAGSTVNLERALKVGDRLDGHFVQGHVDATAICTGKEALEGSWLFHFKYDEQFAALMIEKGSVCINGVSLTAFNVGRDTFSVTIIPYTYEHTNFSALQSGDIVNIEFDVLGKYLLRSQSLK
ncbi:MAG: riboflavin synthase [Bacteroidetes bacterium]|nr:riboflavin synthase [Bacteroidota bacterium]